MIHRIEMPMPGMLGTVNCYLVVNSGRAALIDTGMASERNVAIMEKQLARWGVKASRLEKVLCTHYHPDHCGLGKFFQESGTPVLLSRDDAEEMARWQESPLQDEQLATFYGEHELPVDFRKEVTPIFAYLRSLRQPFRPDVLPEGDGAIDIAGIPFVLLHTTGHTDGHVCFFQPDTRVLVAGDHILGHSLVNIVTKYQSRFNSPLAQYLLSLKKISALGTMTAITAHGDPVADVPARCEALAALHHSRIIEVKRTLSRTPQSAYELSCRAFGQKRRTFSKWLNMAQTISCIEYLEQCGEVDCHQMRNRKRYSSVG
ncbi:MAG: MBL fold metallo-hydrolase [Deltaproteobacteria bacterium]|nr:MBL fold metallo-hydrolase [Deltaproteobacteria bacterium]